MTDLNSVLTADNERAPQPRSVSFLIFVLRFTEPGGVTVPRNPDPQAPWGRARAHLLLDTDPAGRPQLPGTSLAGALREMIREARGEDVADTLFGRLLEARGGPEVDARASQIWVLGSRPGDVGGGPGEFRASTRISRFRGAAADNALRLEEVLPVGTRFEVFLRWDDAAANAVEEFTELLTAWRPLIGRGVSRGRGRCAVDSVRHGTLRLDEADDLLRWLTMSGPELARDVAVNEVHATGDAGDPRPVLRVRMSIAGPWRIGSGEPPPTVTDGGRERQVVPILRAGGGYLVPGSGLKGLLRSRAEFILRSVGVIPPPCDDEPCGTCWTCEVFGFGGGQDVASAAVGARSAIRITDAVVSDPVAVRRKHVAIDRFTGGAMPQALYEVEALEAGGFDLLMEQLAGRMPSERLGEIRAVCRLVLEDLDDGIIGMGGGTARGYGSIKVHLGDAEASGALPSGADARAELDRMVRNSERVSG